MRYIPVQINACTAVVFLDKIGTLLLFFDDSELVKARHYSPLGFSENRGLVDTIAVCTARPAKWLLYSDASMQLKIETIPRWLLPVQCDQKSIQ